MAACRIENRTDTGYAGEVERQRTTSLNVIQKFSVCRLDASPPAAQEPFAVALFKCVECCHVYRPEAVALATIGHVVPFDGKRIFVQTFGELSRRSFVRNDTSTGYP